MLKRKSMFLKNDDVIFISRSPIWSPMGDKTMVIVTYNSILSGEEA